MGTVYSEIEDYGFTAVFYLVDFPVLLHDDKVNWAQCYIAVVVGNTIKVLPVYKMREITEIQEIENPMQIHAHLDNSEMDCAIDDINFGKGLFYV